jgi:4-aminobutyrate aminotransferase-like enzyme
MINAFAPDRVEGVSNADLALIARREKALGGAYRLFYDKPLHFVRGEGVWLFDPEGHRYLDAYNNVASVGHCRPEVVEAIARQAAVLNTHSRYLHEGVVAYAEQLLTEFPPELDNVMFTCTGSEANDLALRIARAVTGGQGLIVTKFAYHGVTAAIAEASPSLGSGNPIGEEVWRVPAPLSAKFGAEIGAKFAEGVERALGDMKRKGVKPAALLVDTIFSSDGIYADPPGFLKAAETAIRASGGLFIADEVQAGFGRTGSAMWGFQRHGLTPDLVTMGKPMGNGHPIAGVAARSDLTAAFGRAVRYFNTFGGNPVSCAAGAAVLDVIRRERLVEKSATVGRLIRARLAGLALRRRQLGEVRGDGLFVGVDLVRDGAPAPEYAIRVVNRMRALGVLVSATGPLGSTLKIRPPLVFGEQHVDILIDALDEALDD